MEEADRVDTMGVSEGGEKIKSIQESMVMEQGVISRDKQGMAAWAQVFIVSDGIVSW